MNNIKNDVKNLSMSSAGKLKIEWTGLHMPVLNLIRDRFAKERPLKNIQIGACLHVTPETANLVLTLKAGGAQVALCASNPLSTQDEVAASLVADYSIPVFAIKGEDNKSYYRHIKAVLETKPAITMDDGADLVSELHKIHKPRGNRHHYFCSSQGRISGWEFYGSSEETTTGVIRLRAMEKERALKLPVIAVNDSQTKHFFDNRYGTGQSTIDGIMRATNILLAGKIFVVCGYGWCGRGIATRARGMGSQVIVTEVDPVRALEALMDGFRVMSINEAARIGDIFVTATGDKNVISTSEIKLMKDGAILANSGHFNIEVAVEELEKIAIGKRQVREYVTEYQLTGKGPAATNFSIAASQGIPQNFGHSTQAKVSGGIAVRRHSKIVARRPIKNIYVLGEGRLINLVAAEGHPPEVMDMSFANQALAAQWILKSKGKLEARVYTLPEEIDKEIARLKLKSLGVEIDKLTEEQVKYLRSWQEGT
jgi:adenosylhomocysteinase